MRRKETGMKNRNKENVRDGESKREREKAGEKKEKENLYTRKTIELLPPGTFPLSIGRDENKTKTSMINDTLS